MILRSIRLVNFRAHADTYLEFAPSMNVLVGPNGIGKTNVLEAIHYLCLSKSFVAATDGYALRIGETSLELEAEVEDERGRARRMRYAYDAGGGKRISIDGAPLERLSDVVGMVPVVVYAPEDHALTAGGPEERRRFLNNIMSQERPVFMEDLLKYRRALRQRNALLARASNGSFPGSLEPVLLSWTAEYLALAARIAFRRGQFVRTFNVHLARAYDLLGDHVEHPTIEYQTFTSTDALDESELAEALRRMIARNERRERERGRSLYGPHRDELLFRIDGREVRRYGSQGQHRTFGMAVRLAQYLYLQDRLAAVPILLLDDVFGNLDPARTNLILELLRSESIGQSFITATQVEPFAAVTLAHPERERLISLSVESALGDDPRLVTNVWG